MWQPFKIFLILTLLQSSFASIIGKSIKNDNIYISRQNLQRSLEKSDDLVKNLTEVSNVQDGGKQNATKMASDDVTNKELNKAVKFKPNNMELGTLDEFLMTTTQRNEENKEEGYFVFPPVIDFGDEEYESEDKPNVPLVNWPIYAPNYEYYKFTSLPPKVEDDLTKTTTTTKKPADVNLSYKPMRPFYASNFPYTPNFTYPVNQNKTDLADRFGESTSVPNLSSKPMRPFYAPNFPYTPNVTYPVNQNKTDLADRFGESTSVPNLSYKPTKPFYWPSMSSTPGTSNPPKVPEDDSKPFTSAEVTTKVPDLNYKPTKPFYLPTMSSSGTSKPPKVPEDDPKPFTNAEVTTKVPTSKPSKVPVEDVDSKPEITTKVPNLSYKPTKPFYLPTSTTLKPQKLPDDSKPFTSAEATTKPPKVPEDEHEPKPEVTTKHDLNYKPTKPFYWPTMSSSTPKPPKVPEDDFEAKPEKTTKVPNLNYKPTGPFYGPTNFPPNPEISVTQKPLYASNFPYTEKSTTVKSISLGYKPMRPFYAQGWNCYPCPTTKNPNYSKSIRGENNKFKIESVNLLHVKFVSQNNHKLSESEIGNDNNNLLMNKLKFLVNFVENYDKVKHDDKKVNTSVEYSRL